MRHLLHKLVATLTRHPREVVTPEWSKKSWTHNVFRVYELFFGRRAGIRFEGGKVNINGKNVFYFKTWEALIAHTEGMICEFFARKLCRFSIVKVPDIALVGGDSMQLLPFRFAIAFGSFTGPELATSNQYSFSFTTSGTNRFLWVYGAGPGGSTNWSSGTYNSIAITFLDGPQVPGDRTGDCWYQVGPTTGTNTVFVQSSSNQGACNAAYYTGVAQTSSINTSTTNTSTSVSSLTTSVTTTVANCWLLQTGWANPGGSSVAAGTGATLREVDVGAILFDSNGGVSSGSNSMTLSSTSGNINWAITMAAMAPVATAVVVNPAKFFPF